LYLVFPVLSSMHWPSIDYTPNRVPEPAIAV
jgi:hypothetical protein